MKKMKIMHEEAKTAFDNILETYFFLPDDKEKQMIEKVKGYIDQQEEFEAKVKEMIETPSWGEQDILWAELKEMMDLK